MRKVARIAPAALALFLANALPGQASAAYFPWESVESYYETHPAAPAPNEPPPGQPLPETRVKAPPRMGPALITEAPEFLFPAGLGFGVAVAVPYDLFYLKDSYYFLQGGFWYRSASYNGPWTALGYNKLPPELRKHKVAKIRALRNQEYKTFWENRDHYRGKRFRPGMEHKQHR